jgi:hypothetical protein
MRRGGLDVTDGVGDRELAGVCWRRAQRRISDAAAPAVPRGHGGELGLDALLP